MRRGPLLATLRRVEKVDATLYDSTGQQRGGVLKVPQIMDVELWSVLAVAQQATLMQSIRDDVTIKASQQHVEPLPGPLMPQIEGVHFHRPDPYRRQDAPPLPAKRPPPGMIR